MKQTCMRYTICAFDVFAMICEMCPVASHCNSAKAVLSWAASEYTVVCYGSHGLGFFSFFWELSIVYTWCVVIH